MNLAMLGGKKMTEMTNIALDAMGGDNAPAEIVKGAVEAVEREPSMKVFLVGIHQNRAFRSHAYSGWTK